MAAVQRIWAVVAKSDSGKLAHRMGHRSRTVLFAIVSVGVGLGQGMPAMAQPPKTNKNAATQQNQVQDKSKPQAPKGTPQAALNLFADAANFQNNAAYDLSIVEWKKLIAQFPKDPIVSKAQHYLGICYLRSTPPQYEDAIKAFESALVDKALEVREESLFNLGWCLYVQGRDAEKGKGTPRLKQAGEVLQTYLKSYADGSVADRALFYAGECEYLLGDHQKAAGYYKQLVGNASYAKSSIRPDAIYALGVNYEELKNDPLAKDAFDDFLKSFGDHKLATDVRMRRAEIAIRSGDNEAAAKMLKQVVDASDVTNLDYALYRYGFALAKAGKFNESAEVYKRLAKEFPQSQYSTAGVLAAGQTLMRDKRFDEAGDFFKRLLGSKDERAAEAAHWLCQIQILKGKAAAATPIARDALTWGKNTPSATLLTMDLAESLMEQPEGRGEAKVLFENLATEQPKDPLAARATYNAAFLSLQTGEPVEAKKWANEFLTKFAKDPLRPDATYVLAEASMQVGEHADAIKLFDNLIREQKEDPMLPTYQLRSATARFLKGDLDAAIDYLGKAVNGFKQPPQQAEAYFLIGACQMRQSKYKEAVSTLAKANQIAPKWNKADETLLIQSQAYQQDEKIDEAMSTLATLVREFPNSRFKQQAELRSGQLMVGKGEFEKAISLYDGILQSKTPTINLEFVTYAKAYALMQLKKFAPAIELLQAIAASDRKDNVAVESRMALGISQRSVEKYGESVKTFQQVIDMGAEGETLANALYEQGLSFTKNGEGDKAKANFQRIRKEFPDYKGMDKVLYEGAWVSKDRGETEQANLLFKELSEKFPKSPLAGEANFHEGQIQYAQEKFDLAIKAYSVSFKNSADSSIQEKSLHKMGWAYFKLQNYDKASETFAKQLESFPAGELLVDATFMQAQCSFKQDKFDNAFMLYKKARQSLEEMKDPQSVSDTIKTLIYLQGAQSARELKKWDQTEAWLEIVRKKFPESSYLPETLFELANCYQNQQKPEKSLELYSEVSNTNRNEIGARARFMMGEVYFSQKEFSKAIPEFRRVMFGYGAQQAPDTVKNWQARSAIEAGRCAELLIGDLSGENRTKAIGIARDFYKYVLDNHSQHELVKQAETRIAALNRM